MAASVRSGCLPPGPHPRLRAVGDEVRPGMAVKSGAVSTALATTDRGRRPEVHWGWAEIAPEGGHMIPKMGFDILGHGAQLLEEDAAATRRQSLYSDDLADVRLERGGHSGRARRSVVDERKCDSRRYDEDQSPDERRNR